MYLPFSRFSLLTLLGLCLILYGCNSTYYVANSHNASMLTEAGELSANASVGSVNSTQTINIQAAFSPVEHLGIRVNSAFFTARESSQNNPNTIDDSYGLNGRLFEGEVGYYRLLGDEGFMFDIYGGFGQFAGSTQAGAFGEANFLYNRLYVQPSFGLISQYVDLNFSLKAAHLDYNTANYEYPAGNGPNADFSLPLTNQSNHIMLEPAFTARIGYEYVKLQTQLGFTYNLTGYYLDYDPFFVAVGLVVNFKPSFFQND